MKKGKKWIHHCFKSYNPDFPRWFSQEKGKLRKVLGKAQIEHVGSTSIPGLGGKGIVDIAIYTQKNLINLSRKKISQQGYEEWKVPPKMKFFSFKKYYGSEPYYDRVFHIHITSDKEVFEKMTLFRDYLKTNPKILKEYARIKKKAARLCNGNISFYKKLLFYRKAKNPFIKSVIKRAEKEKNKSD